MDAHIYFRQGEEGMAACKSFTEANRFAFANEEGTFGRAPFLRKMPDGSWLLWYHAGGCTEPTNENFVAARISTDQGGTWSEPRRLFHHKCRGVFPAEIFVDDGVVHGFIGTYNGDLHYFDLKTFYVQSSDSGRTWSQPASLPGHFDGYIVNACCRRQEDGAWLLPVSYCRHVGAEFYPGQLGEELSGSKRTARVVAPGVGEEACGEKINWYMMNSVFEVGVLISQNKGTSYTFSHVSVQVDYENGGQLSEARIRGVLEPNVVELSDGALVIWMREDNLGRIWESRSYDGGYTWNEARQTDIPNPGSKFRLFPTRSESIILVHNPNPNPGWNNRNPLEVWVSHDDLKTWPKKIRVADVGVPTPLKALNYPDGFLDEDKKMLHFVWEDTHRFYLVNLSFDELGI